MTRGRRRRGPLAPDPEIWSAFHHGPGLREVLEDFYTRVFDNEQLAPFFVHTNKAWAVDKQFSFLRSIFTGEGGYFGMRPRNAHHWMVISDELFDYRESLLEDCLRRYGLPDHLIKRVRALDEVFRKQVVKDEPISLKMHGIEKPAEGYDTLVMPVGTLCDDCGGEVPAGETVTYHVRTGHTYCAVCRPAETPKPATLSSR